MGPLLHAEVGESCKIQKSTDISQHLFKRAAGNFSLPIQACYLEAICTEAYRNAWRSSRILCLTRDLQIIFYAWNLIDRCIRTCVMDISDSISACILVKISMAAVTRTKATVGITCTSNLSKS